MRPDTLTFLDSHWAAHLRCSPSDLRSQRTLFLPDPDRAGAAVWLIDKTCALAASPPLTDHLRELLGSRAPGQAFEPGRLKMIAAEYGLPFHGPEAVLAADSGGFTSDGLRWINSFESASEIQSSLGEAGERGLPLISISLAHRAARRAADACGFELYATVIYIGERTHP